MTSVLEALKSAQFVVDASGQRVAVQLNPTLWSALVTWLESEEHIPTVEELTQNSEGATSNGLLVTAAAKLSEPSLARVWDNSEDDIYNDL